MAVVGDVRQDVDVERTVAAAAERFSGINVVINSASDLHATRELDMKKYDLIRDIQRPGTSR